jgi:hypothetical protein
MTVKEIKDVIEKKEVKFQVKNLTNHNGELRTFQINHIIGNLELHSVIEINRHNSMNVDKFGSTCMWLYSYDMLDNKTKGKISYKDIIILED